jgi:hypothetical protein
MEPQELTVRLLAAELELQAKGYPQPAAQTATKRALKYARSMSGVFGPEIRERAFRELLEDQLRSSEAWLEGVAAARTRGDYRRGMERAARDGQLDHGLRKLGLDPDPARTQAWAAAVSGAADAWEQK